MLPGAPLLEVPDLIERSELVILAVPASELAGLVSGLATTGAWQPGQLVMHTAAEFGTGVLQVPLRNPVELAQRVLTLHLVSGGRFLFGVGAGWNEREFKAFDIPLSVVTISIGGNRSITVSQSETATVALQRTHSVGVNETISVGGAQEMTVNPAFDPARALFWSPKVNPDNADALGQYN